LPPLGAREGELFCLHFPRPPPQSVFIHSLQDLQERSEEVTQENFWPKRTAFHVTFPPLATTSLWTERELRVELVLLRRTRHTKELDKPSKVVKLMPLAAQERLTGGPGANGGPLLPKNA
jgi:hypothetical protein